MSFRARSLSCTLMSVRDPVRAFTHSAGVGLIDHGEAGSGSAVVTGRRFRRFPVPPVPRREAGDGLIRQGRPPSRSSAAGAGRTDPTGHRPPRPCSGDVSERRLDDLARVVGLLGRPVPERRAENRGPRPRSDGTGASWAASTPRSASRSASGTRADCRRRESARRRESPPPAGTAGPGARASPSCAWPRSSTPRRPRQSRPTLPAALHPTAPPSGPATRTPA